MRWKSLAAITQGWTCHSIIDGSKTDGLSFLVFEYFEGKMLFSIHKLKNSHVLVQRRRQAQRGGNYFFWTEMSLCGKDGV